MKKYEPLITWTILIIVSIAFYGYAIRGMFHECKPHTIEQLQAFLGVEVDGVIGKDTIAAYEQYSFTAYATRYMTASGAPKGE